MKPEQIIPEWGEREFNYRQGSLRWQGISNCLFGTVLAIFASTVVYIVSSGLASVGKAHPALIVGFALLKFSAGVSVVVDGIAKIRRANHSKIVFYPEGFRWFDNAGRPSSMIAFDSVTRLDEGGSGGWSSRHQRQYQSRVKAGLVEFVFTDDIDNYDSLRDVFKHLARRQ